MKKFFPFFVTGEEGGEEREEGKKRKTKIRLSTQKTADHHPTRPQKERKISFFLFENAFLGEPLEELSPQATERGND